MKTSNKSKYLLIFFIILGGILGTILGDIIGNNISTLSFLKNMYVIGTSNPLLIDIRILTLSFGLNIKLNIMSMIGIILAIIIYRKY